MKSNLTEILRLFTDLSGIDSQIENIMIFVSDALRWDYLPDSVAEMGVTFKTVAASLYNAASFPSMATGIYPYSHGVYTFFDMIPKHRDYFGLSTRQIE